MILANNVETLKNINIKRKFVLISFMRVVAKFNSINGCTVESEEHAKLNVTQVDMLYKTINMLVEKY